MTIRLDGRTMCSRGAAHEHLKERLGLPDYYGRNLDALYDLLTERGEPTVLEVCHHREMVSELGAYGESLLYTLRQAAGQNPALEVRFCDPNEDA